MCVGVDDLLFDEELDVAGIDQAVYGSLAPPKFRVVERRLYLFISEK